ncbi:MAG TPA: TetR family transcriptional regulator [Thermoleophilaceae bacterium]
MATETGQTSRRDEATAALLDAAERLLIKDGHAGLTTRRVAAEAGLNHGLVHYYFGSMEELLLQVLERFTARLTERQRTMYESEAPFIEKWRTAMQWLGDDVRGGYAKVWWELQAMAWNHPEMRERVIGVDAEWRSVVGSGIEAAIAEYGLDPEEFPADVLLTLVFTFNKGMQTEQMAGISTGHEQLAAWIDRWIVGLEKG